MLDTGFPRADAENDFLRARRRQVLAALAHCLRRQRRRCDRLLTLDGVVGALGRRGQRRLGLQTIRLDTIVGTAGSRRASTAVSAPPPAGCGSAGSSSRWRSGAARRSRRSRCTASAACTS